MLVSKNYGFQTMHWGVLVDLKSSGRRAGKILHEDCVKSMVPYYDETNQTLATAKASTTQSEHTKHIKKNSNDTALDTYQRTLQIP